MIFTDYLVIFDYVVILPAIILGIIFKDKLIRIEQAVKAGIRQTIRERRISHERKMRPRSGRQLQRRGD